MNILHISSNKYPSYGSIGKRTNNLSNSTNTNTINRGNYSIAK